MPSGAGLSLDLTAIANQAAGDPDGYSRLNSIEAIDLTGTGANNLILSRRDVDDLTGFNWLNDSTAASLGVTGGTFTPQATEQYRQLLITGDADDSVTVIDGTWSNQGTLTLDGTFSSFAAGTYNVWNRDGGLEQLIVEATLNTVPTVTIIDDITDPVALVMFSSPSISLSLSVVSPQKSDITVSGGTKGTFTGNDGDSAPERYADAQQHRHHHR